MASIFTDALVPQVTAKTISTTAVQISTVTQLVVNFTIEANSANTGVIYVGASNVDSTAALRLSGGDSYSPPTIYAGYGSNAREYDLSEWYVRASAASQKVSFLKIRKANQV